MTNVGPQEPATFPPIFTNITAKHSAIKSVTVNQQMDYLNLTQYLVFTFITTSAVATVFPFYFQETRQPK